MIYLMRHGERGVQKFCQKHGHDKLFVDISNMTEIEREKTYKKVANINLNDKLTRQGIRQVKQIIPDIAKFNITKTITSPHFRCVQTSKIIAKALKVPIIYEPRFCERPPYYYVSHLQKSEFQSIWDNYLNYNFQTDKIEDCPTFVNRIFFALTEIEKKYSQDNVLIIGHSCLRYAFEAYFNGLPDNGMLTHSKLDNCQIVSFNFANKKTPLKI